MVAGRFKRYDVDGDYIKEPSNILHPSLPQPKMEDLFSGTGAVTLHLY